jgi:hypothetical protein
LASPTEGCIERIAPALSGAPSVEQFGEWQEEALG